MSLIPPNVTLYSGCIFKGFQVQEGQIKISFYEKDGKNFSESVKVLVGADGAFSRVRKQLGLHAASKVYIAIQEWFESDSTLPYYSAIFEQSITDFYAWTIPKDGSLIFGAALPIGQNPMDRFERLKFKMNIMVLNWGKGLKRTERFYCGPNCWRNRLMVGETLF